MNEAPLFWSSLQVTFFHEERRTESLKEIKREPNNTGRVQRRSAKVAIYYLHELAGEELAKEWPKRKVLQDLIPDDRKVQGLKNTLQGLSLSAYQISLALVSPQSCQCLMVHGN